MRNYPAKLLLFGEYTVTLGSSALAVPIRSCAAHWTHDSSNKTSAEGLRLLYQYLLTHSETFDFMDLEQLNFDLQSGWTLTSDIPAGYGLGSSGSVIAAVYDVYSNTRTEDLFILKGILASMENAFHGQSSGMDPLVSYLNSPVLVEDHSGIKKCDLDISEFQFFLIDSGNARSTFPLVQIFQDKMNHNPEFRKIVDELRTVNESAIQACISGDKKRLFGLFQTISTLQQKHFSEMILSEWISMWSEGLSSGDFYLKLCGAGGGGLILGMCREGMDIHKRLPQCKFIQI